MKLYFTDPDQSTPKAENITAKKHGMISEHLAHSIEATINYAENLRASNKYVNHLNKKSRQYFTECMKETQFTRILLDSIPLPDNFNFTDKKASENLAKHFVIPKNFSEVDSFPNTIITEFISELVNLTLILKEELNKPKKEPHHTVDTFLFFHKITIAISIAAILYQFITNSANLKKTTLIAGAFQIAILVVSPLIAALIEKPEKKDLINSRFRLFALSLIDKAETDVEHNHQLVAPAP